jgi:holo-[acyl-carrier protein] synthase
VLGLGIDLVDIDDVTASLQRFGDRFTARVFTPEELAQGRAPRWLACCFAAKEAALKSFSGAGPSLAGLSLRSLALVAGESGGRPVLRLGEGAAQAAQAAGLAQLDVEVSVTGHHALAIAVASFEL